jgi:hypothetical protein
VGPRRGGGSYPRAVWMARTIVEAGAAVNSPRDEAGVPIEICPASEFLDRKRLSFHHGKEEASHLSGQTRSQEGVGSGR